MSTKQKQQFKTVTKSLKKAKKQKIEYPEDMPNKLNKKIEYISNQFSKVQTECISLTCSMMENRLFLGGLMKEFKRLVKKKKLSFEKEFNKHVSCISFRTAERYMQVAEVVDLDEAPALILLGQNQILSIYKHLDHKQSETIEDFLDAHGIDCDFDLENEEYVNEFQNEISELIHKLDNNTDEDDANTDDDDIDTEDDDDEDDTEEDNDDEDDEDEDEGKSNSELDDDPDTFVEKIIKNTQSIIVFYDDVIENKKLIKKESVSELKSITVKLRDRLKRIQKIIKSLEK